MLTRFCSSAMMAASEETTRTRTSAPSPVAVEADDIDGDRKTTEVREGERRSRDEVGAT